MDSLAFIKDTINFICDPRIFFTPLIILFFIALFSPRFWARFWGVTFFMASLLFFALGLSDKNFYLIVTKADNIPIVVMIFLVGYFIWFSLKQANENDKRIAEGKEIDEKLYQQKTLTWPDLVYIELIALILATVILIIWSIQIGAPLEEWANPTRSPNPSKAPWYFLGLQEVLVYFDPWIAGVLIPLLIIFGLMAIPYIDRNPEGSGYYSFAKRKFSITVFLSGFVLWTVLIVIGTFLRGPNWSFFGLFESWDIQKIVPLINVQLSELIWTKWFGMAKPESWFIREIFGILILFLYIPGLPVGLARAWKLNNAFQKVPFVGELLVSISDFFKDFYDRKGPVRYYISTILLLIMAGLIIKMYLRWIFNLKYIVSVPEYFFNI